MPLPARLCTAHGFRGRDYAKGNMETDEIARENDANIYTRKVATRAERESAREAVHFETVSAWILAYQTESRW